MPGRVNRIDKQLPCPERDVSHQPASAYFPRLVQLLLRCALRTQRDIPHTFVIARRCGARVGDVRHRASTRVACSMIFSNSFRISNASRANPRSKPRSHPRVRARGARLVFRALDVVCTRIVPFSRRDARAPLLRGRSSIRHVQRGLRCTAIPRCTHTHGENAYACLHMPTQRRLRKLMPRIHLSPLQQLN